MLYRYARVLWAQVRASLLLAMQYRAEFFGASVSALISLVAALLPLVIVFGDRRTIAGWTLDESLVVVGIFTLLKALLGGAVFPSLQAVVEHVRQGTLDYVLIKPVDAQFLISTARLEPWRLSEALGGIAVLVTAFVRLDTTPNAASLAIATLLITSAAVILYALLMLAVALSFFVVRADNLSYLLASLFDAARWPISVFSGIVRLIFTFVLPLAVMTTYPAAALLGRLEATTVAASLAGAAVFVLLARLTWMRALRHYTSASS
ncbi:MAG: ABC-2 family transporter protein [Myxococcota bacterium]